METKDFRDTIAYLQEENNRAIDSWKDFLADIIGIVVEADENPITTLNIVEELSNLRGILNKLKK